MTFVVDYQTILIREIGHQYSTERNNWILTAPSLISNKVEEENFFFV
jgi:hypothetical protein